MRHSHLNPAHHYPRIFIEAASHTNDSRLRSLAVLAFLYAAVRFVEAYGLWRMRVWAVVCDLRRLSLPARRGLRDLPASDMDERDGLADQSPDRGLPRDGPIVESVQPVILSEAKDLLS